MTELYNVGNPINREERNNLNATFRNIQDQMSEMNINASLIKGELQDDVQGLQTQINMLVVDGDSSPEAAQARVGYDSHAYSTLKQRLDTEIENTISKISTNRVNVKDYGAIGDGLSDDTLAINNAIDALKGKGGGTLFFPSGTYIIDFVLKVDFDCYFEGESQTSTIIKVKDQSNLFHDANRTENANNVDVDNLYRDYYSMIFVNECDFGIKNMQLDGNAQNNFSMLNGNKYNVVIPGNEGVNYYRYYHGIQTRYRTTTEPKLEIDNCYIHHLPWNAVVINNNGLPVEGKGILIQNSKFESSTRDLLSLHNISNSIIKNNKFLNPDSHAVHFYIKANNVSLIDNHFSFDQDFYSYMPRPTFDTKGFVVLGSSYDGNIIETPLIQGNVFDGAANIKNVTALNLEQTIRNLRIVGNKSYNVYRVLTMKTPTIGNANFLEDNDFTYTNTGLRIIPFGETGDDPYVDVSSTVPRPFSSNLILRRNSIRYALSKSKDFKDIYYKTFGKGNTISSTGLMSFKVFIENSNILDNVDIDINGVFEAQREKTLVARERFINGDLTGSSFLNDTIHVQNSNSGTLSVNLLRITPLIAGGSVQVNLKLLGTEQFTGVVPNELSIEYDIGINLSTNDVTVYRKGGGTAQHTFTITTMSDGSKILITTFNQYGSGIINVNAVSRNHFISPILTDYSSNFF